MNELGLTPYADRRIQFLGLRKVHGYKLKIYSVLFGENEIDLPRFECGLDIASREIPPVDASLGRLGVGFAILHQGQTGDYVVLSWWDRENELPTRVYVSDHGDWRPASESESFCVWDLEIFSFERDAYLRSILCRTGASISNYLEGTFRPGKAPS
ncbi:MAG: hypothetical protein GTO41_05940 [Burkholderiales bacterium]|nr:hypothetical protein [Burkholderiales bacterium]